MAESREKKRFAKRSLGQNFLVDRNIIEKIISAVPEPAERLIIEIGPGRGALTAGLADIAGALLAIEKDTLLAAELNSRFSRQESVSIVEADVLQFDFSQIEQVGTEKPYIVANLPYNISTPVLRRFAQYSDSFAGAVLMLQKEVVERISADAGDRERGFLTVLLERYFLAEWLFDVPPNSFRPAPRVNSAVMRITPHRKIETPESFERIVSQGFQQKRKKLSNNLKKEIGAKIFADWANSNEVSENIRPAELTVDHWISLSKWLDQD